MEEEMYDIIFFDLDGTLLDSAPGILESVKYALSSLGIKEEREEVLNSFIGPPLFDAFSKNYNLEKEVADRAVEKYRENYNDNGAMKKFTVYNGVENMLKSLNNAGLTICLATAKPREYAYKMLESVDFTKYFHFINGASFDETKRTKSAVIKDTINTNNFDKSRIVMVGDRENDITGARKNNIASIGVLYGYGDEEELRDAGCKIICKTPADVVKEILK